MFDDYRTQVVAGVRQDLDRPGDEAFARLAAHVRAAAATATDPTHRGCLLAKGTAELAEHDPAIAAVVDAVPEC